MILFLIWFPHVWIISRETTSVRWTVCCELVHLSRWRCLPLPRGGHPSPLYGIGEIYSWWRYTGMRNVSRLILWGRPGVCRSRAGTAVWRGNRCPMTDGIESFLTRRTNIHNKTRHQHSARWFMVKIIMKLRSCDSINLKGMKVCTTLLTADVRL